MEATLEKGKRRLYAEIIKRSKAKDRESHPGMALMLPRSFKYRRIAARQKERRALEVKILSL